MKQMKQLLTALAVVVALTSLALAQPPPAPGWGEPGAFTALTRYAGKMLTDPVYLVVVVVSLLIASRFFYWILVPLGAGAGVIGVLVSVAITDGYSTSALSTAPFWGAVVFLGLAMGLAVVVVLRMLGKQE